MAGHTVILDPTTPKPSETRAIAAIEPVRPKAFRRPPGWVAPSASAHAAPAPSRRTPALSGARKADETVHKANHDRLYGVGLVLLVIGINLLAGLLLSVWNTHITPRYHTPAAPHTAISIPPAAPIPAERVTLYASPLEERRTLRIDRLDMPIDSTDAIELPPANPADDR